MRHTHDEIRNVIVESIKELLGKKDVDINEKTDPIRDLGLESSDGLDFACILTERLGCDIPHALNPFVDDAQHRARRLEEMVDLVWKLSAMEVNHV